jgi:hypothetical protein
VLGTALANQLLWNLWHAFLTGMPWPLAVATGAVPVLLAMGTSVLAERAQAGPKKQVLTYAVMVGAIAISVFAQFDLLMRWTHQIAVAVLFPAVSDLAVLIALHSLMSPPPAGPASAKDRAGTDGSSADSGPVAAPPAAVAVPVRAERETVPATGAANGPVGGPVRDTSAVPAASTGGSGEGGDQPAGPVRRGGQGAGTSSTSARRPRNPTGTAADAAGLELTPKDQKALALLGEKLAGRDPAEVSIGEVRRLIGEPGRPARFERGKRLREAWVAMGTVPARKDGRATVGGTSDTAPAEAGAPSAANAAGAAAEPAAEPDRAPVSI